MAHRLVSVSRWRGALQLPSAKLFGWSHQVLDLQRTRSE